MRRFGESSRVNIKSIDSSEPVLDFAKCVICQGTRDGKTSNPKPQSYTSLSKDLEGFRTLNMLPKHIEAVFKSEDNFKELLINSKAVFHKACRDEYNNQKLERQKKKHKKEQLPDTDNFQHHSASASIEKSMCIFCQLFDSNLASVDSPDTYLKIVDRAEMVENHRLKERLTSTYEISAINFHDRCKATFFMEKDPETKTTTKIDFHECYNLVVKEIIGQIENTRHACKVEFFKLSQLAKFVTDRLCQMGLNKYTHTTRLKEQLLLGIPGLRSEKIGKDILLFFDDHVKYLVAKAIENPISDEEILARSIEILRTTFHQETVNVFNGSLDKDFRASKTVSKTLVNYISSLLEGCDSNTKVAEKIAENIAQLIQFNYVKRRDKEVSYVRHNIDREQPLPVYLGLMVHLSTGKKKLVEELNSIGASISYSRVLDIERAIAVKVCDKYRQDNCVCPPNLKYGLFTTAAIDNIDHNPTSTSAKYSFHGTGISLIQHMDEDIQNSNDYLHLEKADFLSKRQPSLPESYYNVPQIPSIKGNIPVSTVNWDQDFPKINPLEYTKTWLESSSKLMDETSYDDIISWSAHNSRLSNDISRHKSTSAMLPLLKDDINSPSVVAHSLDIIIAAMNKVNPGQVIVCTADEPVFAIEKQLQWLYPEKYGEDKIVMTLGNLTIFSCFPITFKLKFYRWITHREVIYGCDWYLARRQWLGGGFSKG